jgi:hypothetical protein
MRRHWRARRRDAEDRSPRLRSRSRSDAHLRALPAQPRSPSGSTALWCMNRPPVVSPSRIRVARHAERVIQLKSAGGRRRPISMVNWAARPDSITSFGMIQVASDAGNAAGLVSFLWLDRFLISHVCGRRQMPADADDRRRSRSMTFCENCARLSPGSRSRPAKQPRGAALGCPERVGLTAVIRLRARDFQ